MAIRWGILALRPICLETDILAALPRHSAPTFWTASMACPIPDRYSNPVPHILRCALAPPLNARRVDVHIAGGADAPSLQQSDFWTRAAGIISTAGKLPQSDKTWADKASFLSAMQEDGPRRRKGP